ncbi:MAG: SH3 domain-containing protein [Turicibacter sp.]|nr:SH3 domain-containing protein [Turicibacter sp.]
MEWVLNAIKRGECLAELGSGSTALCSEAHSYPQLVGNGMTSLVSVNVSTESVAYQVGDKVRVKESATQYATGESMAWFVKGSIYEVTRVEKDRVLLADIVSWVYIDDVEKVAVETSGGSQVPFLVEIICDELNIREKADFNSKVVGVVTRGEVFTITEECNGLGRLKSGAGYISMHEKYVKKL